MRLINFLVCDDIRNEQHNKISIMGTYADTIKFLTTSSEPVKWPQTIRLGVFIRIALDNDQEKDQMKFFKLESKLNSITKVLAESAMSLEKAKGIKGFNIAIVFAQCRFEEPGTFNITFSLLDQEKKVIQSFACPEPLEVS